MDYLISLQGVDLDDMSLDLYSLGPVIFHDWPYENIIKTFHNMCLFCSNETFANLMYIIAVVTLPDDFTQFVLLALERFAGDDFNLLRLNDVIDARYEPST